MLYGNTGTRQGLAPACRAQLNGLAGGVLQYQIATMQLKQ